MRLNKYIAHSGYCSRRKADDHIFAGHVTINDQLITNPATQVSDQDKVHIENHLIELPLQEELVYFLLNKPLKTISTTSDDRDRPTILDIVRSEKRIYPIGRLDFMTTGVIILTNDGELTQRLSHPSFEINKCYQVSIKGEIEEAHVKALKRGVIVDGKKTSPARVTQVTHYKGNSSFLIEIHEGRNRQIRKMLESFDYEVAELDRITYAGLSYAGLRRGEHRPLTAKEVNTLKQIGQS